MVFDCKFRHIFRWSQVDFVCFSKAKQKRYTADNKQYNAFANCDCVVNVCFRVVALMPLSSQDGFYCPIELLVGFRPASFIHVVVV